MRLINADELVKIFHREGNSDAWGGEFIRRTIEEQPTIEAVPLEDYRSMEQTVHKLTQAIAEAEPIKQTIEKFRDYQIEWLTAHNDIEFCEQEENLIVRFLKDTAEYAIKFGIDEVEE